MANEPERPIEKLLRAAAKKREEEAGTSFDLHPATRRLLQGEVARKLAKDLPKQDSPAVRLGGWWPRLAWGGAILATLVLVVWMIFPKAREQSSQPTLAWNKPAPEPTANPASSPAPAPAAPPPAPTPAPAEREIQTDLAMAFAAKDKKSDSPGRGALPQTETAAAASSAPPPTEMASANAAAGEGTIARAQPNSLAFNRDTSATASDAAPSMPAVPSGAIQRPVSSASEALDERSRTGTGGTAGTKGVPSEPRALNDRSGAQVQRFARVNAATDALAAVKSRDAEVALGLSPPQSVLAAFSVVQRGGELRIIDKDGSVYSGYVQPATEAIRRRSEAVAPAAAARTDRAPADSSAQNMARPPATQASPGQEYTFRVTGTNVTLGKKVVFKGQLTTVTNLGLFEMTTNALGDFGGIGGRVAPAQLLLNSRITGEVSVGGGKEVEINAAAAKP